MSRRHNSIIPVRASFYAVGDICPGEVLVEGLNGDGEVIWSYDTSAGAPTLDSLSSLSLGDLDALRVVERGTVVGTYELPYEDMVSGQMDVPELLSDTAGPVAELVVPTDIESCDVVVRALDMEPGEVVSGYDGFSLRNTNDDISLEDRYLEVSLGGNPNQPGLTFSFVDSRDGNPQQSTRFDLAPGAMVPIPLRVSAAREGTTLLVAEQKEDNRFRPDPTDTVFCANVTVETPVTTTTTAPTTTVPTTPPTTTPTTGPTTPTTGPTTPTTGPTTPTTGPTTPTTGPTTPTTGPTTPTTGPTTPTTLPTTTTTTTGGPPTTPPPRRPGDVEEAVDFVEDAIVDDVPEGAPGLGEALNNDDDLADKLVADLSTALVLPALVGAPAIAVGPAVKTAVVGTGAAAGGVAAAKVVAVAVVAVVAIGAIAWAYSAVDARLDERATVSRIETKIEQWRDNDEAPVPNRDLFIRPIVERLARLCWDQVAAGSVPDAFGQNACEGLPIYFPSEADLGEAATMRAEAIAGQPTWVRQYRRVSRHRSGWLRGPIVGGIRQGVPGCPRGAETGGRAPAGKNCDEFPNAIFLDGGQANDPLVRWIDAELNVLEGNKLGGIIPGNFFTVCSIKPNPIENSREDPFLVIPLVNPVDLLPFPPTFPFCPGRLDG